MRFRATSLCVSGNVRRPSERITHATRAPKRGKSARTEGACGAMIELVSAGKGFASGAHSGIRIARRASAFPIKSSIFALKRLISGRLQK